MARRRKTPNRETAHRMFTTEHSDPSRKATFKYAAKLKREGNLAGAIAVTTIIRTFGVKAKGAKLVKVKSGKAAGAAYVRADVRQRNNALAGYLIAKYEEFVAKGMPTLEALQRVTFAPDVKVWVDSGQVGYWAENFIRHKVIVNETKLAPKLRANGPRKAKADSDRARWKAIGDAHRAGLAETREAGKIRGRIEADVRAKLREAGVKGF